MSAAPSRNRLDRIMAQIQGFDAYASDRASFRSRYMADDPCVYCGKYRKRMEWDHMDARYFGNDSRANLTRACWFCNRVKNRRSVLHYLRDKAVRYWKIPETPESAR